MNDLRFAFRQLRKNPGFTAVVVLTLALGIGANSAMFSVVNAVLLKPLPYEDPERLVTVCESNPKLGFEQINASAARFFAWRERAGVFSGLAGEIYESFNVATDTTPFHVRGAYATANYFDVLGARFALGRGFESGEDELGRHLVVVITYDLWQGRFGGRPDIIGHALKLSGERVTIAGVLARGFRTFNLRTVVGRPTANFEPQLWMPYPFTPQERASRSHFFVGIGRLKPGITVAHAQEQMDQIAAGLAEENPAHKDWGVAVRPLHSQVTGASQPLLLTLFGGVSCVLLMGCANLVNLFLAREVRRGREYAIRAALGARWRHLIGLSLSESLLLAVAGGLASLMVARWILALAPSLAPSDLPRIESVQLDWTVFGFTLFLVVLTGLVIGLFPALHGLRADPHAAMQSARGSVTGGGRQARWRRVLVITQIAVALGLLAGAGLCIRSFQRLAAEEPGFDPEHLFALDFTLHWQAYGDDAKRIRFLEEIVGRVAALPGVQGAATVHGAPFGSMLASTKRVTLEGDGVEPLTSSRVAGYRQVSPGYFRMMRIPVVRGREFTRADHAAAPPVVMINERLARVLFGEADPLGRRVAAGATGTNLAEIVGVVSDVKPTALDVPAMSELYLCTLQYAVWIHSLVVRTAADPMPLVGPIEREFLQLDREVPAYNFRMLGEAVTDSMAPRRFLAILTAMFGAVALGVAALGVAGVVSNSVAQRRRELGIRTALGAKHSDVVCLVMKEGIALVAVGVGFGLLGALALTRLLTSQLYLTSPSDSLAYLSAVTLLIAATLGGCWLPARRAARVDPMEALRSE